MTKIFTGKRQYVVLHGDRLKFYVSEEDAQRNRTSPEGQYVISRKDGVAEMSDRELSFVLLLFDYKVRSKQR